MKGKMCEELKAALKIEVVPCEKNVDGFCRHNEEGERHRTERKEQLLSLVRNMQSMKRQKKRIGFSEFVLRHIPFMGKDLWLTQGVIAFSMFGILYLTINRDLQALCIRHIPILLGLLAIMLVMASIPLMLSSYHYKMYEIELATRISLPRLLAAKMILLALEYMAVFAVSVGLSMSMADVSAVSVTLYFVPPLLVACTGCVQIIRHMDGWEEAAQKVGVCEGYCVCLAALLILLYRMKPVLYGNDMLGTGITIGILPMFLQSVRMWLKESGEVSDKASAEI